MNDQSIITDYYRSKNIIPTGPLAKDIQNNNLLALNYVMYAIKHLLNIRGMTKLLAELAAIRGTNRETNRETRARYHNSIQELHAIYFVRNKLKHKILEVESRDNKIFSPHRRGQKSCDIKTQKGKKCYYFESKDSSSLLIASHNDLPKCITFEEEAENWIVNKAKSADFKGANYLICRAEIFTSFDIKEEAYEAYFKEEWISELCQRHFGVVKKMAPDEIVVLSNKQFSSYFMGIYILKDIGFIRLKILHN